MITSSGAPIRIEANPYRVRAMFAGHVIADTKGALTVYELGKSPVHFFPAKDVETGFMGKTAHSSHDDSLGEACCYTLVMEGEILENAVCAYDSPAPGAEALRGYMSFAEDHFEVYELNAGDVAAMPRATHVHRSVA